jgi:hypothetical protein
MGAHASSHGCTYRVLAEREPQKDPRRFFKRVDEVNARTLRGTEPVKPKKMENEFETTDEDGLGRSPRLQLQPQGANSSQDSSQEALYRYIVQYLNNKKPREPQ